MVEALEELRNTAENVESFKYLNDLQFMKVHETKKRTLILTSTNEKSMRTIHKTRGYNNRFISFMLVG